MSRETKQIIGTITEPHLSARDAIQNFALLKSGFRAFFFCGPVFVVAAILYFILVMSGAVSVFPSAWDIISWHRHEMIFGYAGAIIIGFLFTAVPNWTGHPTPKDTLLGFIVFLWLAGRIVVFTSSYIPLWLVAFIDISFFLVCAAGILPALVKSKNKRNYFFIFLLLLLAIANGITHYYNADVNYNNDFGIRFGLNIVIIIMIILGGRVIPFFTERPLGLTIVRNKYIERLSLAFAILALITDTIGMKGIFPGFLFAIAAVINALRLYKWNSLKTFSIPLLWVLHAGYAWLVAAFALRALYNLGISMPYSIATHAFTTGGIGVLTIGMMARVSLGHSGRILAVGKPMLVSFICINLAAIVRVFGVLLFPNFTMYWLEITSLFWVLAFCIFIWIYTPILVFLNMDSRVG